METTWLLRSLSRLARALREAPAPYGRSPLRLADVLDVKESAEEAGRFTARPLERSSRPVLSRKVSVKQSVSVVGIDSSSRRVEASAADVVVASVAAHAPSLRLSAEWPSLSTNFSPRETRPFIYVLPNGEVREESDPLISFRNVLKERFTVDYEIEMAEDEARRSLEDWMMVEMMERCRCVLLVDGPIYFVSRAIYGEHRRSDVSKRLLYSRLEVLERLEKEGIPVIGVVKRVEKSNVLSMALGGGEETDVSLIMKALQLIRPEPGRVYVSPPFSISYPNLYLEKISRYVVVPPGKHQSSPALAAGFKIYRLETTKKSEELLSNMNVDMVDVFLYDSLLSGSTEPISIKASDMRASLLAEVVARELRTGLSLSGMYLSYETRREATWS